MAFDQRKVGGDQINAVEGIVTNCRRYVEGSTPGIPEKRAGIDARAQHRFGLCEPANARSY